MKSKILLTILLTALAWSGFSGSAAAQPPPGKRFAPLGRKMLQEVLQTLTPEERQQFLAAHKAAKNDPAVVAAKQAQQAAGQEFKNVMKKAMLQQDPSLAAAFEKLEAPEPVGAAPSTLADQQEAQPNRGPQQGGWGALLNNLTPEERQKMKAARAAVKNQPEVQQVEKARAAADKEFRETLRTHILSADPAAGPVLDKVEAAMKEKTHALRRGLEPEPSPTAQTP